MRKKKDRKPQVVGLVERRMGAIWAENCRNQFRIKRRFDPPFLCLFITTPLLISLNKDSRGPGLFLSRTKAELNLLPALLAGVANFETKHVVLGASAIFWMFFLIQCHYGWSNAKP
mmetsp:Transcript_7788/g.16128  ORF Transcript_7788/g.16128 Transcript_7788/m.16128 type:complete len:116 (+) Transcript_7788:2343-2690(+)